jgi:hypothetical protein
VFEVDIDPVQVEEHIEEGLGELTSDVLGPFELGCDVDNFFDGG